MQPAQPDVLGIPCLPPGQSHHTGYPASAGRWGRGGYWYNELLTHTHTWGLQTSHPRTFRSRPGNRSKIEGGSAYSQARQAHTAGLTSAPVVCCSQPHDWLLFHVLTPSSTFKASDCCCVRFNTKYAYTPEIHRYSLHYCLSCHIKIISSQ